MCDQHLPAPTGNKLVAGDAQWKNDEGLLMSSGGGMTHSRAT